MMMPIISPLLIQLRMPVRQEFSVRAQAIKLDNAKKIAEITFTLITVIA